MSHVIELTPDDIVKNWDLVSYAYAKAAFLTKKENTTKMLQATLLNLYAGRIKCWALLDEGKIKLLMGVSTMRPDNNLEGITSVIISPIYGFDATSNEEKLMMVDKIKQYKNNIKADSIYFISQHPIVWNVAEKAGFKFISKIYTDKEYGGQSE